MMFDDFVAYAVVAGAVAGAAGAVWWTVQLPSNTEQALSKMEFDGYSDIETAPLCRCPRPLTFRATVANGQPVEGMICCGVVTESE